MHPRVPWINSSTAENELRRKRCVANKIGPMKCGHKVSAANPSLICDIRSALTTFLGSEAEDTPVASQTPQVFVTVSWTFKYIPAGARQKRAWLIWTINKTVPG